MTKHGSITVVYDGECPLCSRAALAYRIRQSCGELHLLDARHDPGHPLLARINELKLDLDEGMVLFDGKHFHHGSDALKVMARYGDRRDWFNLAIMPLFRSDIIARSAYPLLRWIRNRLLAFNKIARIGNIEQRPVPIFQSVFGESWEALPPVLRRRYANRSRASDVVRIDGRLDIVCAGPIRWFAPLFRLLKAMPPVTEKDVPVTVEISSDPDSNTLIFERIFRFHNHPCYRFRTSVAALGGDEIVEVMPSRLGLRMRAVCSGAAVEMLHLGYVVRLGKYHPRVPLGALLGRCYARETAIDERRYELNLEIVHPLWGKIYGYRGLLELRPAQ